jgi:HEAT repeat protein
MRTKTAIALGLLAGLAGSAAWSEDETKTAGTPEKTEESKRDRDSRGPRIHIGGLHDGLARVTVFDPRGEDHGYRHALGCLDAGRWDEAIAAFDKLIATGKTRVDASTYWKAYALHKLGRRSDALAALATLKKDHPDSRWLPQAKALEIEVQQASGQAPSPESQTDDELKLIALDSLARTDPERAVPLLEKLLTRPGSRALQSRALFVLAQSDSPKAREIVGRVARGQSNPDLQVRAVQNLAAFGGRESLEALDGIFRQTSDPEVKKAVLQSFAAVGARDRIYAALKSEKDPELRCTAVRSLVSVAGRAGDDTLLAIYEADADSSVRTEVVRGLVAHGNVHALVGLARKEKDPKLKKSIVGGLSSMKSPEATEYLLEILEK